jgi:hypothetical protein
MSSNRPANSVQTPFFIISRTYAFGEKGSIPTKVGIQKNGMIDWIPASAGMDNLFLINRVSLNKFRAFSGESGPYHALPGAFL